MRNCRTMKRIMSISLDGVQTLVLGSMTLDVVLRLDALPGRMEDVNIHAQQLCIGGCAYNVYQAMKCCASSARLLTQRGSGMYAEELDRRSEGDPDILTVVAEGENGCCYCLVEPDGERSFLSLHGVEYHYPLAQLAQMDLSALRFVYLCGIDLEEAGDEVLNNLLKALNEHIYNNGIKVKSPVISFFSASNEIPNLNNLEEKPLRAVRPLRLQGTHQICRRLGKPYESLTPKTAE